MKNYNVIFALDLGTACGWAILDHGELSSGVWNLTSRPGTRIFEFLRNLKAFRDRDIDLLAYEDVQDHSASVRDKKTGQSRRVNNVYAAHLYGAFRESLLMANEIYFHADLEPINVSTVKKAATGKMGGAATNKAAMLETAQRLWPGQNVTDHNQADALCVLLAACKVTGQQSPIEIGADGFLLE